MGAKNYRDLKIWKRAMDLVVLVYRVTAKLPPDELYGLRSQMRRASVSVPSNTAEGEGRATPRDFIRFLFMANGSRRELETQTLLARRLDYIPEKDCTEILDTSAEIGRMHHGLVESLKKK